MIIPFCILHINRVDHLVDRRKVSKHEKLKIRMKIQKMFKFSFWTLPQCFSHSQFTLGWSTNGNGVVGCEEEKRWLLSVVSHFIHLWWSWWIIYDWTLWRSIVAFYPMQMLRREKKTFLAIWWFFCERRENCNHSHLNSNWVTMWELRDDKNLINFGVGFN